MHCLFSHYLGPAWCLARLIAFLSCPGVAVLCTLFLSPSPPPQMPRVHSGCGAVGLWLGAVGKLDCGP
eukprot:4325562-Alexandrium_andersonii.AAC.1